MRKLTQIVYFYLNLKNDMFSKPKIMSRQKKGKTIKIPQYSYKVKHMNNISKINNPLLWNMKSLSQPELLCHVAVLLQCPSSLTTFFSGMYVQPLSWWFPHILLAWLHLCEGKERMRAGRLKNMFSVCFKGRRQRSLKGSVHWVILLDSLPNPILFVPWFWQKETHRLLPLTWAESPLRYLLCYTIKHLPRNFLQKHCYPIYSLTKSLRQNEKIDMRFQYILLY